MKLSQVQDVQCLLRLFDFKKKLIVRMNDKIISANFIKVLDKTDCVSPVQKIDIDTLSYSNDCRFDQLIKTSQMTLGKILRTDLTKNELITLKKIIDFCLKNNPVPTDDTLYDVTFLESSVKLDFMLVQSDEDFEIIGLSD